MTSFRQIRANRRNARNSAGPITARRQTAIPHNAVGHGLTAETVVGILEDAEDYQAFGTAIIADYDAHAMDRELALRWQHTAYKQDLTDNRSPRSTPVACGVLKCATCEGKERSFSWRFDIGAVPPTPT
jgi:hypothetical protein